jgi:hypothetical protein
MTRSLYLVAATLAVAITGNAIAGSDDAAPPKPAFADTVAAANGREVPSQVEAVFQDRSTPRVVGADAKGQEYAVSRGSGGVCLIALRAPNRPGFEVCGAEQRDITTMTMMGEGRVRTLVLQAHATKGAPAALPQASRVAPGLWVAEAAGGLPGG